MDFWNINSLYSCDARFIQLDNSQVITDVTQNHQAGKNNSDVLGLWGAFQNLKFIPLRIAHFFPNLEALFMGYNEIEFVTREQLSGLRKLKQFDVPVNRISAVDSFIFVDNPHMTWISFYLNPLRNVGAHAFSNLPFLRSLALPNATCIDGRVDNDPTAIPNLIHELYVVCPPSLAQIESDILNGEKFQQRIDPLLTAIQAAEKRLEDLEARVLFLETPPTAPPRP